MTTTARRFVIDDCDDHDGSRVVVCIINVHIVCLVESGMRDDRNINESHHSRPRLLGN